MNNVKLLLPFAAIVAIAGMGLWYFNQSQDGEQVFCTQDAMLCPDGSYVGRTGPKCEFVCPSTAASPTVRPSASSPTSQTWIGNVVKDNPGLTPGVWYLISEAPGQPARTNPLRFTSSSMCTIPQSVAKPCSTVVWGNGDRAVVVGTLSGSTITVQSLSTGVR